MVSEQGKEYLGDMVRVGIFSRWPVSFEDRFVTIYKLSDMEEMDALGLIATAFEDFESEKEAKKYAEAKASRNECPVLDIQQVVSRYLEKRQMIAQEQDAGTQMSKKTEKEIDEFMSDLKSSVAGLKSLADRYNELDQDSQDRVLEQVRELKHPFTEEMIVGVLRRWPVMP